MPRKKREKDPWAETAMTVTEAAKVLRMSPKTVYRGIERGEIPSIRAGRTIRVPSAKLAEMLGVPYPPPGSTQ